MCVCVCVCALCERRLRNGEGPACGQNIQRNKKQIEKLACTLPLPWVFLALLLAVVFSQ
jgi:hypothetical protein